MSWADEAAVLISEMALYSIVESAYSIISSSSDIFWDSDSGSPPPLK